MEWIKGLLKSILHLLGYDVRRISRSVDPDVQATLTVKESGYYAEWSTPGPIFSPWIGYLDFQRIYEGAAPYTIVSPDRCYILVSLARYASFLRGQFAECGVYQGGTALLLCRILRDRGKTLYLFDSFKGLPKGNEQHDEHFYEGQFAVDSVDSVRKIMSDFIRFVDIRQGWIPDTFAGLENENYAFAHIDVDLYQSALDCCTYFYPRLTPGGVLLFDEYGFPDARGEKHAVDEYFADKPERPIALPTGQAMVLKLPFPPLPV